MKGANVFRPRALALVVSAMAVLITSRAGVAQDVEDATREACRSDALRLCGQFVPDVARITDCMTERFKEVSPQCRDAMVREGNRARARAQGRRTPSPADFDSSGF